MRQGLLLAAAAACLAFPAGARADDDAEDSLPGMCRKIVEGFEVLDADADGKLSRTEIPIAALFDQLDADKDGLLSRDEIRRGAGEKPDKGPPGPLPGGKGGKDGGKDGKRPPDGMPRGGPAEGEDFTEWAKRRITEDPRFDADARLRQFLQNFDRDKSGKIERKEYAGADGDRIFRDFDRDRDGAMEPKELLSLMKDQLEDLQKARHHPTRGNFLVLFDLDDDRDVSREEYAFLRGPASQFRSYDDDGDGTVTYDELIYPGQKLRNRPKGADADGAPAAENRSLWDIYDKDRDGRVTAEEFGGGEAVFRRLDRNRDGVLTLADA
jgi:Ca2+-binding EF-hand superfamily protein